MIKFDFKTYVNQFISESEYTDLYQKKDKYIEQLNNSKMTGWTREISSEVVEDIKSTANYIKSHFDCLVIVGIGGSYLGSYAFHEMFKKYFGDESFEIIYAGTTLSSEYLDELLLYLDNKNYCLNVISKSGNTMETTITYKCLMGQLKRKYEEDELRNHIIITTDKEKGSLREEVNNLGCKSFIIPDDIGGRFSFITPAHLLPLALNYDIDNIIDGYYDGKRYIDQAFSYSVVRQLLFEKGKTVEAFCVDEEKYIPFMEWLKQLFGESEGKSGLGILPISLVYTRDLHSMGQFIQDGNKIIFETLFKITHHNHYIEYEGKTIDYIKQQVFDSVVRAHNSGEVPCLEIEIAELNVESMASLIYFFQLSAAFSGFLMGINPFNQPGVEVYKEEIRKTFKQ